MGAKNTGVAPRAVRTECGIACKAFGRVTAFEFAVAAAGQYASTMLAVGGATARCFSKYSSATCSKGSANARVPPVACKAVSGFTSTALSQACSSSYSALSALSSLSPFAGVCPTLMVPFTNGTQLQLTAVANAQVCIAQLAVASDAAP